MEIIRFIPSLESQSLNYTFTIIQMESLNTTSDIMIQYEPIFFFISIPYRNPLKFSSVFLTDSTNPTPQVFDSFVDFYSDFLHTALSLIFRFTFCISIPSPSFVDIPSPTILVTVGS
ncbi:hypothetical protein Csa_016615 [Cucumis sativus]|nr:hypothetical protein Csa_016615 [Cucumis sativus]